MVRCIESNEIFFQFLRNVKKIIFLTYIVPIIETINIFLIKNLNMCFLSAYVHT